MFLQSTAAQPAMESKSANTPLRLAILPDFHEEQWPSMDLCADMLVERVKDDWHDELKATIVRPAYQRCVAALPIVGKKAWAFNVDRFVNRHWSYSRHVRARLTEFDAFHICDHSYAQLALGLPGDRTGVFCYDLDAFRCLLAPEAERRPAWFRWMMRRVLRGMQKAAVVFYCAGPVREVILRHGLVDADRLVYAPLGHAREFVAEPVADADADRILSGIAGRPCLLHVGSCIPRKRIEFLLELFAVVRSRIPELRLVKVGGAWSAAQQSLIHRLDLHGSIVHAAGIARSTLAVLYRRANLVLLPSDAEGFGLPIVEALACGTPVLASDLPVLREVGGDVAHYAPLLELDVWCERILGLLDEPDRFAARFKRREWAQNFTWREHARIIVNAYRGLGA